MQSLIDREQNKQKQPIEARATESDVVQLLRARTPLVDDPAGRAMVRTRIERMAPSLRRSRTPLLRVALVMAPIALIALALVTSLLGSDGTVISPVATATAAATDSVAIAPEAPAPAEIAVQPSQQRPTQPGTSYRPHDLPGKSSGPSLRPVRPEPQLPTRAQAAIIIRQAPAPEALALFQAMQRRQYSG